MANKINLAIQILPKAQGKDIYALVDKAIEAIQRSGLPYVVCPFETVIEGPYDDVMRVVKEAQDACFAAGAEEIITNLKVQQALNRDVFIDDKIGKYK